MSNGIIRKAIESAAKDVSDAVFDGASSRDAEQFRGFIGQILDRVCSAVPAESAWIDSSADNSWTRKADPNVGSLSPDKLLKLYELVGWGPDALAKNLANQIRQKPELANEVSSLIGVPMPGQQEERPIAEPLPIPEEPAMQDKKKPTLPRMGPRPKRVEVGLGDPSEILSPKDEFNSAHPTDRTPGVE